MSSTTEQRVKNVVTNLLCHSKPEKVTNEARFTEDLAADSLDLVELMMNLENEFNIAIPDKEAAKINTVGEAIAYIDKAIAEV